MSAVLERPAVAPKKPSKATIPPDSSTPVLSADVVPQRVHLADALTVDAVDYACVRLSTASAIVRFSMSAANGEESDNPKNPEWVGLAMKHVSRLIALSLAHLEQHGKGFSFPFEHQFLELQAMVHIFNEVGIDFSGSSFGFNTSTTDYMLIGIRDAIDEMDSMIQAYPRALGEAA